ncbi:three-helix bundle dimerization domain-containing protein [Rhodococcus sp. NPDC056960]|uniref:three-helix bundle dimerization domain-containing protein n=1 Tax=Rhodococcus sp. NPDC056960 TaxID=3345982 RepID=UPI00363D92C8
MTGDDELLRVEQVIERLIVRYPSASPVDIEHIVRTVHKRLAESRVRDFIPLLVERAAGRALAARATPESIG